MTDEQHWEKMYYMVRKEFSDVQEFYTAAKVKTNDINHEANELRKRLGDIDAAIMRCPISGIYDTFTDVPNAIDQMAWHIKDLTDQNKKLRADITQWRAWYPTVHTEDVKPDVIDEMEIRHRKVKC